MQSIALGASAVDGGLRSQRTVSRFRFPSVLFFFFFSPNAICVRQATVYNGETPNRAKRKDIHSLACLFACSLAHDIHKWGFELPPMPLRPVGACNVFSVNVSPARSAAITLFLFIYLALFVYLTDCYTVVSDSARGGGGGGSDESRRRWVGRDIRVETEND